MEEINKKAEIIIGVFLLFDKNKKNFLLYSICFVLNRILKEVCRYSMGDKVWPIVGNGNRPNSNISSYGMPSGHSQAVGFFIAHQIKTKSKYLIPSVLISLEVMYSRIANGHHTIQQIVVGFLIGLIFGLKTIKY